MNETLKVISIAVSIAIVGYLVCLYYHYKILRFEKLNGRLNANEFQPNLEYPVHFPWEDVKPCFNKLLPRENFKGYSNCPQCGLLSESLVWVKFKSPRETWDDLCGRSGPLSICPKCKIQVEFDLECLS